ncbi:MAG TPA: response regulator [Nitrospiraceae bacterium]|nr:response regulator [Nitrospiraceae bacterium]
MTSEAEHHAVMATRARSSEPPAVTAQPLVAIVDDDESVRESLPDLLRQFGFVAQAFASADEFLSSGDKSAIRCLLLDVCMPGMSGPQLQQELASRGVALPIIFITARTDASVRDSLMQGGASACLFKPFSELQLRTALDAALLQGRDAR